MSEYFEYIDAYFQKELSDSEKEKFEQRCIDDEQFANDVAFYISSRAAIKDTLLEQKKMEWSQLQDKQAAGRPVSPVRGLNYRKWIPYAAAACLVLAVILFPLLSKDSPQELADNYIGEHLNSISQTMDASADSLQLGIASYNNKDYARALTLFEAVYAAHPEHNDALRYLGQTHLVTGNFARAIEAFEQLSKEKGYSNPGLFLKSVALMKRGQGDDEAVAKGLLEKIAKEGLDGSKEAEKWLKNWPNP